MLYFVLELELGRLAQKVSCLGGLANCSLHRSVVMELESAAVGELHEVRAALMELPVGEPSIVVNILSVCFFSLHYTS